MRIGLDIGGTKTDVVALDLLDRPTESARLPTAQGPEGVLETALAAVNRMSELTGLETSEFESIGVGIPGMVEARTGRVHHAVNLGVEDLDLGGLLRDRIGVEVRVENDVKAAALGAYRLLALDGSMAFLNLGTGLAAGLVVGGRLRRGASGTAGEIGHISIDPVGAPCACGQRGCIETIASGSGVARQWPSTHPLPARELFDRADAGDPNAIVVRSRLADGVAAAVRVLVLTVDVKHVVIGGGLSNLGDRLLRDVHLALTDVAAVSPFLASLGLAHRVRLLPPDLPAAAVGAALVGVPDSVAG